MNERQSPIDETPIEWSLHEADELDLDEMESWSLADFAEVLPRHWAMDDQLSMLGA